MSLRASDNDISTSRAAAGAWCPALSLRSDTHCEECSAIDSYNYSLRILIVSLIFSHSRQIYVVTTPKSEISCGRISLTSGVRCLDNEFVTYVAVVATYFLPWKLGRMCCGGIIHVSYGIRAFMNNCSPVTFSTNLVESA